jgi:hypothetical protein
MMKQGNGESPEAFFAWVGQLNLDRNSVTGRCEKIDFPAASDLHPENIALGRL